MTRLFCFLGLTAQLSAFLVGNPAQPALLPDGIFLNESPTWSFRAAFLDDYIYAQHYQAEFFGALDEKPPVLSLATDAALFTLNLHRWVDFYGIIGSAKLQMDEEIYTRRELAWGFGAKILLFAWRGLTIGCDVKYFESDQKPLYFVSDGKALDIVTNNVYLQYQDVQGSLGFAYRTTFICPYVQCSYIGAKISPRPSTFLVNVPGYEDPMDASIRSFIPKTRWGLAIGATLIAGTKGTISLESRFFNENAIDGSLELRF
ncbi:MAG: hypothetical protein KGJ02_01765 [Verrucomicrobiota bacterium]|nr:hypothetical protein [Verrucomicrobiota bacterium]